jgi:hypothetical protein
MGDDNSDAKSIKLKPGTHCVSNLEPRAPFLFFDLGTLARQSLAFFAPLREYDVFPCSSILGPGVTSNEEPETRNQFLPRSLLFCALA